MTYKEAFAKLKALENSKYAGNITDLNIDCDPTLGIGVGKIKKLAKEIKKDHDIAVKMWNTPYYEAKLLSVFIEDPKQVTEEQLDEFVTNSKGFMLSDYFAETVICKTPFMDKKIEEWTSSTDDQKKKAGFALLYAKAKKDKKAEDTFFLPYLEQIEKELQSAENWTKESMNYAVMYIGSRNKDLNKLCLGISKRIGTVKVDYGKSSCMTADASKWMKSDRTQKVISKKNIPNR